MKQLFRVQHFGYPNVQTLLRVRMAWHYSVEPRRWDMKHFEEDISSSESKAKEALQECTEIKAAVEERCTQGPEEARDLVGHAGAALRVAVCIGVVAGPPGGCA